MQKQKRWQFVLILAVTALTIYNILPTIFFYTKPLNSPINESRGNKISIDIIHRMNKLEQDSIQWIKSFCNLLQVKPKAIEIDPNDPGIIKVSFAETNHAQTFAHFLPRAGSLIPFVPAQLSLYGDDTQTASKLVKVQRKIPVGAPRDLRFARAVPGHPDREPCRAHAALVCAIAGCCRDDHLGG